MKIALWISIPLLVIIGIVGVVISRPPVDMAQITEVADTEVSTPIDAIGAAPAAADQPAPTSATLASGRYEQYDTALVDDNGYSSTILFFYAAWCPECRAYDKVINEESLPDGVQILRVTYDDSQDLRQKYGVTIQSTFVRVDSTGGKQVLWNGYGKDKSVSTILENT
jgi:thiol-disulfide isomerase/thioredoxin